jgi:pyruvate-ferredoxin/flavodoxin oxidoreductase
MKGSMVTIDGNEAAARVAHKLNEVIAIYPITPSSSMGELSDEFSAKGHKNIYGTVPDVVEMQSEGGASGAVHGALQKGALTTTFTASQGLLLMVPNLFKIAGELTSTVFHVSARTVATHALSIFGDHSDVMACRTTGWGMMPSGSIQEVHDFALIATAASLEARIPIIHFFDGFRSSHEVQKIQELSVEQMRAMIDDRLVAEHRARAMSPEHPVLRGTAQNPDVFFQAREAVNPYYERVPGIVQQTMDRFAEVTGRQYKLFEYYGAPDAERVIVLMASGAEAAQETIEHLAAQGEKVGLIKVRLYRPFSAKHMLEALPKTVKTIGALDRTKEPGALGEPLFQDVATAIYEAASAGELPTETMPRILGGRYGLSSKEFNPAMIKGVLDEMAKDTARKRFTVGIDDDVTHTSVEYDPSFVVPVEGMVQAMFYGLGSDGTVGANKNSVKIIGEGTDNYAQGYFVYDSKKAGAMTVSHLRFGKEPIRSTYLLDEADFIGCHQWVFLEKFDLLEKAKPGAVVLINSPYSPEETWNHLQRVHQKRIIDNDLKVYVIDAYDVAKRTGMGARINTIMQTCFFAISGVLPRDEAIAKIKDAIQKTYGAKGEAIVKKNFQAVDGTLDSLHEMKVPKEVTSQLELAPPVPEDAPEFVKRVTGAIIAARGDELPVSAMPVDGTFPTGTCQYEKRNIALEIPVWDPDVCIQCGKCSLICPHATIRQKVVDPAELENAPATFKSADSKGKDFPGTKFLLQVAPEDCTGCGLCVHYCPAKNRQQPSLKAINMEPQAPLREQERENYEFFLNLPEVDRSKVNVATVKGSQMLQPLFEYSGACAGCGETPYVKLMSQLFGDRAVIANATGCSSIYGGNLPATPFTVDKDGRGPTWSNSLFEDNAEFGFGFRLTVDKQRAYAGELLQELAPKIGEGLVQALLGNAQKSEGEIAEQRENVAQLREKLADVDDPKARQLEQVSESLVRHSIWIVGGDGWAYDIGYGGLDHVLASGRNVNVLVLDTEVYSNTGGQMSKATPIGAIAKFAASGKPAPKKDLGIMAMSYGNIYVAQVAMGSNDGQTVKAFLEAESFDGPSVIIAYSHCIAHGTNMRTATDNHKRAVKSGHWPLYRFDPRLVEQGINPLQLDSRKPSIKISEYMDHETRFKMLEKLDPARNEQMVAYAQREVERRWAHYEHLAAQDFSQVAGE